MKKLLSSVGREMIDALYPPKCALCDRIGQEAICPSCRGGFTVASALRLRADLGVMKEVVSVFGYEGRAGQAVRRLKYDRATSLGCPLSRLLANEVERLGWDDVDVVIPVPISKRRRRERGFNQSELLLEEFDSRVVNFSLLNRVRHTRPQVGLKADERLHNLDGAFVASELVAGLKVLLVDDVITTGGTASACSQELARAGAAEIRMIAFCGESL